jgi:hypothetical protein
MPHNKAGSPPVIGLIAVALAIVATTLLMIMAWV